MIRPEVLAFADEIREAIADANASLSTHAATNVFCVTSSASDTSPRERTASV